MMTLTRRTGYALIALTHLARNGNAYSSAREIAMRYKMSRPLLMNVLKLLAQRGLARSVRGPQGGYTLVLEPDEIKLRDIIQAVEGPIHFANCVPRPDGKGYLGGKKVCQMVEACPVRTSIYRVHDRLIQFLDEVTLAHIAANADPVPELPGVCRTREATKV